MLAIDLLNRYLSSHPYGVADSTAVQLRCTWGVYLRESGTCGLDALDTDRVNDWLDQLRQTRAPDTVRTQRGNILVLWWYAYREGLVDEPPLKVRKLRPIRRAPTAWTLEEVHRLVAVADVTSPWWGSLVRVAYDTAMRLGDLLAMRVRDLGPEVCWQQSKTSRVHRAALRPQTLESVARHVAGRKPADLVWPLTARREAFYRAFNRLVATANIRPGTFRWLRRSAATQLERVAPGRSTELLGHASRSTTEQFYLDRSQLSAAPLPPF